MKLTASQVKSTRQRMDLTQKELAAIFDCTDRNIRKYENGEAKIATIYMWALHGLWATKYSKTKDLT